MEESETEISDPIEKLPATVSGKIFITGGSGFLGANIIQKLVEKNIPVKALYRSKKLPFFIPSFISEHVQWVEGDILDTVIIEEALKDCAGIIHSAALVSFSASERSKMYKVNVEGTKNIVNAAIENNISRFIHISSVAALGRTKNTEIVSENRAWNESGNHTHYAVSKHQAEMEVWRGFGEGLEGVILNPSTVLGFGDWNKSSPALFKNAYKEFPWYTEGVNGFVGVADVAEITVQILQSQLNEKRFIVNSENWSFRELMNCMAEGFDKKKPYRKATPFLGELAWRMEKWKYFFSEGKPLLTKESARVAHSSTRFDNTALLKVLPDFKFTPLQHVIQNACSQYIDAVRQGDLKV